MANTLISAAATQASQVLCCYQNSTSKIQVVRISNIQQWYFERVVFPAQILLFEAPQTAELEIYSSAMASALLVERLQCLSLRVRQPD
jgi:3-hydroxymyristoyl/3-hydroxydecanoyl-(acyl carrier protein) dehydratase